MAPGPRSSAAKNQVILENTMNVHLTYQSGQGYSQRFSDIKAKVSRGVAKRVTVSFRERGENEKAYASFSLPPSKAQQLAHALLTAAAGEAEPIEFMIDDSMRAR